MNKRHLSAKSNKATKLDMLKYGMNANGKKVIQHHVRYFGSDPNNLPEPSSFNIEKVHFGYLAQLSYAQKKISGN